MQKKQWGATNEHPWSTNHYTCSITVSHTTLTLLLLRKTELKYQWMILLHPKSCRSGCGKELPWMLLNVKITLLKAANICIAWFGVGVWDLRSENVMLQACHQWQWLFLMDYGVSIWKILGQYQGSHFLTLKSATPPFPWKVLGPDRFSRRQARRLCLVEQLSCKFHDAHLGRHPVPRNPM